MLKVMVSSLCINIIFIVIFGTKRNNFIIHKLTKTPSYRLKIKIINIQSLYINHAAIQHRSWSCYWLVGGPWIGLTIFQLELNMLHFLKSNITCELELVQFPYFILFFFFWTCKFGSGKITSISKVLYNYNFTFFPRKHNLTKNRSGIYQNISELYKWG